jgi:hypothetical protein
MTFQFTPAVRDRVGLLISIAGVSGAGKTFSGLRVARGLADGDDSKIAFIDTEAGRAKHYAPAPGEKPGPNRFAFAHLDLRPPFSPERYLEAIEAAEAAGFEVIVIDSVSHEWEGEGGLHDAHDEILAEQIEDARKRHNPQWGPFDEAKQSERLSLGAWKIPKMRHKKFVQRLLQCRAHLVMCLRADEKMRIEKVKDDRGREKTVITAAKDLPPEQRWSPICERRWPYEMTLSFVLTPDRPGFPIPLKLQDQHRAAVPLDRPLSEETGRLLREWAAGGQPAPQTDIDADDLSETADARAAAGTAAYAEFWRGLSKAERAALLPDHDARKARAAQADAEREPAPANDFPGDR